ncbi:MAG: SPOR domain-containing protein [Deltaproteobacteria bacterium]|nr:SPOR domain-containing protein [Deltaproteobacteria bacterium]
MSALILLVLLIGGMLYLGGGLFYLYRYLQVKRMHFRAPRLWDLHRRRFYLLTGVGGVLIAGFFAVAWWSAPGNGSIWLPQFMKPHQAQTAGATAKGTSEAVPPPQVKVSGPVEPYEQPVETTTSSTSSTSTTESTSTTTTTTTASTTESTVTTSTAPPDRPAQGPTAKAGLDAWTVCAASFRREAMAQNYAKRLKDQGLPARVSQVDLGGRGIWHRVCVGSFPTLAEAKGQYKAWEKQGIISDAFLLPLR